MKVINIGKNVAKVTLICLMLSCIFARIDIKPLKADPSYFSIEATSQEDKYWGYYGGYHDVWFAIQGELAKIGIDLVVDTSNDAYGWWEKVWGDGWNYTSDPGPSDPTGWDVTMFEWWLQPHALEPWFASMTLNDQTPYTGGFNIHPWMNLYADSLLLKAAPSFDATLRKNYLWGWQEEWMHDPPIAEIYYPRIYEPQASYVVGYDSTGVWWYDMSHIDINETEFEATVGLTGSNPNSERYATGNDTIIYAVSEDVWSWSPMFMDTYTEENFMVLCWDTLYTWTLNWTDQEWLEKANRVEPDIDDYIIVPDLAAGDPIPVGGNLSHLRVPLRENVSWSNGPKNAPERAGTPFNATDVLFTYNCTFNLDVACTGTGDFSWLIERVDPVLLDPGDGGVYCEFTNDYINASAVDFILKTPCPEFTSVISNDWGGGSIVPWTQELEDLANDHPDQVATHKTNKFGWQHPGTGPYVVTAHQQNQYITLERNDNHWRYGEGYGPYVSKIILKWVPLAENRLLQIQNNDIDIGEYPIASTTEYLDMMTWDNLNVFEYNYPASNGVWFNLDHPILSNRYVRQAIAHAIPYGYIFDEILPGWGVKTAYPGKTHIMPQHYYGGEHLFNDVVLPYHYDLDEAEAYLKMWLYAQPAYAPYGNETDPDPTGLVAQGPVGDANFDGTVNFDDFFTFAKWRGYTPGEWTWLPGCDIDPDFDNDEAVSQEDFDAWWDAWGNKYPFAGAR